MYLKMFPVVLARTFVKAKKELFTSSYSLLRCSSSLTQEAGCRKHPAVIGDYYYYYYEVIFSDNIDHAGVFHILKVTYFVWCNHKTLIMPDSGHAQLKHNIHTVSLQYSIYEYVNVVFVLNIVIILVLLLLQLHVFLFILPDELLILFFIWTAFMHILI